jgi:uncharacterized protein YggU (UPF0235/DUF167 family)
MPDNGRPNSHLGAILGGLVALAALALVLSGGSFSGKKTVEGDQDLPPVTTSGR